MSEPFETGTLTTKGGTMTSEGFIPHFRRDGIDMPVALDIPKVRPADAVKHYFPPVHHPVTAERMFVQPDGRRVTVG